MKKLFTALLFSLCAVNMSYASNSDSRLITGFVSFPKKGIMQFWHDGAARTSVPSCASGNDTKWAIDVSTNEGKSAASIILTAYSMSKRVSLFGTGDCTVSNGNVTATQTDAEVVNFFMVLP